jgi:hypothetical protein
MHGSSELPAWSNSQHQHEQCGTLDEIKSLRSKRSNTKQGKVGLLVTYAVRCLIIIIIIRCRHSCPCRVELAQMLCSGLPLPYDYSGLLCETLFAQLLRLPGPRLCPVAFSALIAHAAILRPAFPKYLAGSVRQLYLRLQFLAPELAGRLADVLAHFITNMNFRCGLEPDSCCSIRRLPCAFVGFVCTLVHCLVDAGDAAAAEHLSWLAG